MFVCADYGSDLVAQWLFGKIERPIVPPYYAMAVVDTDNVTEICGALVWGEFTGPNVELAYAYIPNCMTRAVLRAGFEYAFDQMKVDRITMRLPERSAHNRIVKRLGWKEEGRLRKFYGGFGSAIIYGMTREDCRFLHTAQTGARET